MEETQLDRRLIKEIESYLMERGHPLDEVRTISCKDLLRYYYPSEFENPVQIDLIAADDVQGAIAFPRLLIRFYVGLCELDEAGISIEELCLWISEEPYPLRVMTLPYMVDNRIEHEKNELYLEFAAPLGAFDAAFIIKTLMPIAEKLAEHFRENLKIERVPCGLSKGAA